MDIIEAVQVFGLFPTGIILGMGAFILYQHSTFMRFLKKHNDNDTQLNNSIKELSTTLGNLNGFIQGKLA